MPFQNTKENTVKNDWPILGQNGPKHTKIKKINKKLRHRSCKKVLGGYSKQFSEDLDAICDLNLSGPFSHEKKRFFKTYNKTLYKMSGPKWAKKWAQKRADRFSLQYPSKKKNVFVKLLSKYFSKTPLS